MSPLYYLKLIPNIMKHLLFLLILSLPLASCSKKEGNSEWSENRTRMEAEAQLYLADCRKVLKQNRFDEAREIIEKLRRECNLALSARQDAILLEDSVELQRALLDMVHTDSLLQAHPEKPDSLREVLDEANRRIRFYKRKLEHDMRKK